jgi:hypothetical protein
VRVLQDAVTDLRRCLDRRRGRLAGHGAAADGGNDHEHQQHPAEDRRPRHASGHLTSAINGGRGDTVVGDGHRSPRLATLVQRRAV